MRSPNNCILFSLYHNKCLLRAFSSLFQAVISCVRYIETIVNRASTTSYECTEEVGSFWWYIGCGQMTMVKVYRDPKASNCNNSYGHDCILGPNPNDASHDSSRGKKKVHTFISNFISGENLLPKQWIWHTWTTPGLQQTNRSLQNLKGHDPGTTTAYDLWHPQVEAVFRSRVAQ